MNYEITSKNGQYLICKDETPIMNTGKVSDIGELLAREYERFGDKMIWKMQGLDTQDCIKINLSYSVHKLKRLIKKIDGPRYPERYA